MPLRTRVGLALLVPALTFAPSFGESLHAQEAHPGSAPDDELRQAIGVTWNPNLPTDRGGVPWRTSCPLLNDFDLSYRRELRRGWSLETYAGIDTDSERVLLGSGEVPIVRSLRARGGLSLQRAWALGARGAWRPYVGLGAGLDVRRQDASDALEVWNGATSRVTTALHVQPVVGIRHRLRGTRLELDAYYRPSLGINGTTRYDTGFRGLGIGIRYRFGGPK